MTYPVKYLHQCKQDKLHPYSHNQLRFASDLASLYRTWIDCERKLAEFGGRLVWKTISGKEYLYVLTDASNNGRSLGPASSATQAIFDRNKLLKATQLSLKAELAPICSTYRLLRMPIILADAANVLRAADKRGVLGRDVWVVGTHALLAYQLEANAAFPGTHETRDFDLTWAGEISHAQPVLMPMLKAVDSTFTINQERTFQARNAKAFEVELLVGTSAKQRAAVKREALQPIPLPEQNWLLEGKPVDQVLCGSNGKAARIVSPDPRWFALHKMWLSEKPERDPMKKPKDRNQAILVWRAVREFMPHYAIDRALERALPQALRRPFQQLQESLDGL